MGEEGDSKLLDELGIEVHTHASEEDMKQGIMRARITQRTKEDTMPKTIQELVEVYERELDDLKHQQRQFDAGGGYAITNSNEYLYTVLRIYVLEKHIELLHLICDMNAHRTAYHTKGSLSPQDVERIKKWIRESKGKLS